MQNINTQSKDQSPFTYFLISMFNLAYVCWHMVSVWYCWHSDHWCDCARQALWISTKDFVQVLQLKEALSTHNMLSRSQEWTFCSPSSRDKSISKSHWKQGSTPRLWMFCNSSHTWVFICWCEITSGGIVIQLGILWPQLCVISKKEAPGR